MKFVSGSKDLKQSKGLLVLVVSPQELKKSISLLKELEKKSGVKYSQSLKREGFSAKSGESSFFKETGSLKSKAVLILGADKKKKELEDFRKLGATASKTARSYKIDSLDFVAESAGIASAEEVQALLEGVLLTEYQFTKYRKKTRQQFDQTTVRSVQLLSRKKYTSQLLKRSKALVEATDLARDLVNIPASDCNPSYMTRQAKKVAKDGKLKVQVYDLAKLKKMKAGGILGVSRGGNDTPRLVKLTYRPKGAIKKVISLVGKGVTFDTGGLSIKTGGHMNEMKCDMAGSAVVLGAMSALAELKPSVEVRAYIPLVENMVSEKSVLLGDVLHMLSGKTVEILNTDAEGRLILADAIALAEKDSCDEIIDFATLTGACVVALGDDYAGLFCNDEKKAAKIIDMGKDCGELFWRLPFAEEYRGHLKSSVADIKNIGEGAGAIAAALFLSEFVEKTPLTHIDIAGPAFRSKPTEYSPIGATGFGVRTIVEYLMSL